MTNDCGLRRWREASARPRRIRSAQSTAERVRRRDVHGARARARFGKPRETSLLLTQQPPRRSAQKLLTPAQRRFHAGCGPIGIAGVSPLAALGPSIAL